MRIFMGSKSLFTDKSETKTVGSPAQEEAVRQLNPINLAFNQELANLLGFTDVVTKEATPGRFGLTRPSGGGGFFSDFIGGTPEETELQKTGGGVGEAFAGTRVASEGERNLADILRQAFGDQSTGLTSAGQRGSETLGSGLSSFQTGISENVLGGDNSAAVLEPLFRAFNEQILPGIRSKAIQFGAPSGSREAEVTRRNVGTLGETAGAALGRQDLQRRGLDLSALRALFEGTQTTAAGQFGFDTAGLEAALRGEVAGGEADASFGALERDLAGERELSPLNIILQALSGGTATPFVGGTSTARTRKSPFDIGTNIAGTAIKAFAPTPTP